MGEGQERLAAALAGRCGYCISHARLYCTLFDLQSNVWVMDINW